MIKQKRSCCKKANPFPHNQIFSACFSLVIEIRSLLSKIIHSQDLSPCRSTIQAMQKPHSGTRLVSFTLRCNAQRSRYFILKISPGPSFQKRGDKMKLLAPPFKKERLLVIGNGLWERSFVIGPSI